MTPKLLSGLTKSRPLTTGDYARFIIACRFSLSGRNFPGYIDKIRQIRGTGLNFMDDQLH